nr:uncharacterized protein [Tanacetum cinerariifolium]
MEVLLRIHGVWDVVDSGSNDAKKNNIVKGLLFQSIPEDLVLQIRNLKTRKEMWGAIKTCNLGANRVKEAMLQTLITDFENLKMSDNDTIDAYAAKLSCIASKSATLGEVMSELKLVKKFLVTPPKWIAAEYDVPRALLYRSIAQDIRTTFKRIVLEVVSPVLSFQMVPNNKAPVLQVQHMVPNQFGTLLVELVEYPTNLQERLQENL